MKEQESQKTHLAAKMAELLSALFREYKSPWYYWYTGSRDIAIQAWMVSFIIMLGLAVLMAGGIFWALIYIVLGIALDSVAIVLIFLVFLIHIFFVNLPDVIYTEVLLPILISSAIALILNRVAVCIVIRFRHRFFSIS